MHIFWNQTKSVLLLGSLAGLLVLIGGALGGTFGLILGLSLAAVMNLGAWWFSDKLALKMSGARPVEEHEAPELVSMVRDLSVRAGIPMPRVHIIESDSPNAFATGRDPAHGAVAATTGIMRLLTRDELAGVMAHELAHIKNRDTLITSVAATIGGAITFIAEMAMWSMIFTGLGGNQDEEEGNGLAGMVGAGLMLFLAPMAALVIQMAVSRSREFLADAGGARILGDPNPLADALEKLERGAERQPMQANPATSHLYIVNPLRGGFAGLFSTHPNTQERVRRLRELSGNPAAFAMA